MTLLNKKANKKPVKVTREEKIAFIRKALNLGTAGKPKTFFLRKEMEAICFSITGNISSSSVNTSTLFTEYLVSFGYKNQKTVDSHPVKRNLDFIINSLNSKRKSSGVKPSNYKKYKTRKDKGLSRSSLGSKIFGEEEKTTVPTNEIESVKLTETSLTLPSMDEEMKSLIFDKIKSQSISSLVIADGKVTLLFK